MDWTPVSYAYDGSFAGFLTCVFASYAHREEPMSFSTPEDGRISLWPERTVDTDEARAQRVYRSLAPRLGQEGRRLAVYGFLTGLEEREFTCGAGHWHTKAAVVRSSLTTAVLTRAVGHLTGEARIAWRPLRDGECQKFILHLVLLRPTSAPAIRRVLRPLH